MIIRNMIVLLAMYFASTASQGQKLDSLRSLLNASNGAERLDVLHDLAYECIDFDNPQALKYATEGYLLAVQEGEPLRKVRIGLLAASALRRMQRLDSALAMYDTLLKESRAHGFKQELASALNSAGGTYLLSACYDKALACFIESWQLRRTMAEISEQIIPITNIGVVFYKLKDYHRALAYFLQADSLHQSTGDYYNADQLQLSIAHAYAYLGVFDTAEQYVAKGIELCGGGCQDRIRMQAAFVSGLVEFGLGNLEIAKNSFMESLSFARALSDVRFQLDNIDFLCQIYIRQGRFALARQLLGKAEAIFHDYPYFHLERIKIYRQFSLIHRRLGDFKKASDYQEKYIALEDSIYSQRLTANLMRIESSFLERENLSRIATQTNLLAIKQQVIDAQALVNKLALSILVISVGFILLVTKRLLERRNQNAVLEAKVEGRTRELEKRSETFVKSFHEREMLRLREMDDVLKTVGRVRGLCAVGMMEPDWDAARQCFSEIDAVVRSLVPTPSGPASDGGEG